MSEDQLGPLAIFLCLALIGAHILGRTFVRLRQPKVIGEILTGILLGPSLLGRFWDILPKDGSPSHPSIDVFYWSGLALLMFLSGTETQTLFSRANWKQTQILTLFGTGLPLGVALLLGLCVDLRPLAGPAGQPAPLALVLGIAFAVTSIPVIARIFHDMGISGTQFARMVLGIAVIEDILLWMLLSMATSMAKAAGVGGTLTGGQIWIDLMATLAFFGFGLALMPSLLRRIHMIRWNLVSSASPLGYMLVILCAYIAAASACGVNLVFAAFLAGFAIPSQQGSMSVASATPSESENTLSMVETFSYGFAIPLYFVLVGYRLDLAKSLSFPMLATFLLTSSAVKLASVMLGARVAGYRGLDCVNLAVATNARGGPGIVLASVAFEAQIIGATFYTTLVLTAILTSQATGVWLQYVLQRGWPLLSCDRGPTTGPPGLGV